MLLYWSLFSGLTDLLEDAKESLGLVVKKRTWTQRIDSTESNWHQARELLLEEMIKREERPSMLCCKCFEVEAMIRCVTCSPYQLICCNCDYELHQSLIFHDREWFDGYFKPLKTNQYVQDGVIISKGKYIFHRIKSHSLCSISHQSPWRISNP